MTYIAVPPTHWSTFCRSVQSQAPEFPLVQPTIAQSRVNTANQAIGLILTILTAAGVDVPDRIGQAATAAGIQAAADLGHAVVDEAAGRAVGGLMGSSAGMAPGMIVSNGIAVLRGAVQAVGRSDEMEEYLQQIIAYVQTLARTALRAQRDADHFVRLPEPMIPQDVEAGGGAYNARLRGGYRRGYIRLNEVIRTLDNYRDPSSADWTSKQCFVHLYLMGNRFLSLPQDRSHSWRVRARIEAYVVSDILSRNLLQERERLRRWAMTG